MRALTIVFGLLVAVASHGQDQTMTNLQKVAARLRTDGIELVYSSDRVNPDLRIGYQSVRSAQIATLEQSLRDLGLQLIHVRPDFLVITGTPRTAREGLIVAGVVRDASTGKAIAGARITTAGYATARTDARGLFVITDLAPGLLQITVQSTGFATPLSPTIELRASQPEFLEIALQPLPFELSRVIVSASHFNLAWIEQNAIGHLSASDLLTQPSLGNDPIRAVNRLPGIATSGLSARPRVRGGAPEETLLVLDDQPLVDPFHLKGFQGIFSAINAATLETIDYYAGGFPIDYGNRLSSVVHMSSREIPARRHYEVGLGMLDSYLLAAGHDEEQRQQWLGSVRYGGLDWTLGLLENDFGSPEFYDAYARYERHLDNNSRLRLAWLLTRDELTLNNSSRTEVAVADSRDGYYWLSYLRDLDGSGNLEISLSGLSFSGTREGRLTIPGAVEGSLLDQRNSEGLGLRMSMQQPVGLSWHLRAGASLRRLDAEYHYLARSRVTGALGRIHGTLGPATGDFTGAFEGNEIAAWAGIRWQPADPLVIEGGLRWDDFDYLDLEEEDQFSLRVNLRYQPRRGTLLRAAWGQFRQAQSIEELHIEQGETNFLPPQLAEHTVLSWDQEIPGALALRVEAYQKRITDPWRRVELLYDPLVLLPDLQFDRIEVNPSSAKARGIEITLRGESEPMNWWLSFTRADVKERVDERRVVRSWDQAYAGGGGLEWTPGSWTWSIAANYHDGWPTASLEQLNNGALLSSARNERRFDDFLTLDLRTTRQYRLSTGQLKIYFELSNAFNRDNPCCTEYRLDSAQLLQVKEEHWLPIIPSFGLVWSYQ